MFDTFLIGLINGNTYALIALGLSLIISVANVINFAQGSLFALGAMVGWYLLSVLDWPLWAAIPGVVVASALLGYVVNLVAVRPFAGASSIVTLLATFAAAMLLDNGSQLVFGPQTRSFPPNLLPADNFVVGGIRFGTLDLVMFATSVVSMLLLASFLRWHRWGRAIRSTAQDRDAAAQMGIPVRRMQTLAFILASVLGGLAGLLVGLYYGTISPSSGYLVGIQGFAAATMGGLGSLPGAVACGLLLGVLEAFGVSQWGDSIRPLITFGCLLGTLWLRPGGLFGRAPGLGREPMTGSFLAIGKGWSPQAWQLVLLVVLAVTLPLLPQPYLLRVCSQAFAYGLIALSLVLLSGSAGQISLGQAGAVAVGAYASVLLGQRADWPFLASVLGGGVIAAVVTTVLVAPGWKLRGHYQSIATLAVGAIVAAVILNWEGLTRGAHGIAGIAPPVLFGHELSAASDDYLLNLVSLAGGLWLVQRLIGSHLGRTWAAVRDDEVAARALGIEVNSYKALAFALGSVLAGIGGALLAHEYGYLDPTVFDDKVSQLVLTLAVLGGLNSAYGVVLGALVLVGGLEFLRVASDWRLLGYGALLLVLLKFRPQGLLGGRRT